MQSSPSPPCRRSIESFEAPALLATGALPDSIANTGGRRDLLNQLNHSLPPDGPATLAVTRDPPWISLMPASTSRQRVPHQSKALAAAGGPDSTAQTGGRRDLLNHSHPPRAGSPNCCSSTTARLRVDASATLRGRATSAPWNTIIVLV